MLLSALHGAVRGEGGVRAAAADARGVDDRPATVASHERGLGGHGGPVRSEVHGELLVDVLVARGVERADLLLRERAVVEGTVEPAVQLLDTVDGGADVRTVREI